MKDTEYKEYYQVYVKATVGGEEKEFGLDLAYVYVKKKKKARCLGIILNFECDPCTSPFLWKSSS